jgi:AAA ATPase domain
MIVSRAEEVGRLDELLERLYAGAGCALVVRGDPGIGKTTLLDALVQRCGDGVTVLRARGVETEAELAFAALADLLAPVIDDLASLPAPQAAALAAALAVGPPAPGDRLAVCVATLALLQTAAARRPVIAVVDDVHWLDAASRECVLYAARRAGGRMAVALAARDPWDAFDHQRLPLLRVGPLGDDGSRELLRRVAPDLAPPVARAVVDAAAGNPLALVELPATLAADQRAGVAEVQLPLAPRGRLRGAFGRRIEELDPLAGRALLVAAAHAGEDVTAVAAACTRAGTDIGLLAQAEERGLVRLGDARVRFAHPLVRGAAYDAASADERRRAHRALAHVLAGEQRAWHLAAAAVGPDEGVAAELEQLAGAAAARRGFAPASTALERAARLSPDADAGARSAPARGSVERRGR